MSPSPGTPAADAAATPASWLARLSPPPDLSAPARLIATALACSIVAAALMVARLRDDFLGALGDTDDAMRIVMVRDLASGTGWYDQLVERLQPPQGLQVHWSRLIDGGVAGLERLFALFTSGAGAEAAARFTWPLLWIVPTTVAALLLARRLGGPPAVFAAAIVLVTEKTLYLQFAPGRIDHHGPQIALLMAAFSGACARGLGGAVMAGAATALGLAVGLEALVFQVLVAASFCLAFAFGGREEQRRLTAYAAALGATLAVVFVIQTPPARWAESVCDALGVNLLAGVLIGAVGLAGLARLGRAWGWKARLSAIIGLAAVVAAAVLAMHPSCIGGPFGDVDPQLKRLWLDHVQEVQPVTRVWVRDRETVYTMASAWLFGSAALAWLLWRARGRVEPPLLLAGALLVAAILSGAAALRMATYAHWIATPLLAAAVADIVNRIARGRMIPLALAACLATPVIGASAVALADRGLNPKDAAVARNASSRSGASACYAGSAYAALAALPPGLVLGDPDLGPFILAHTSSSALAAPYHRMHYGFTTARAVMEAQAQAAELEARRAGVDYILQCPAYARSPTRRGLRPDSLQKALDADRPPAWLRRLDTGRGPLRLYGVRP